MYNIVNLQRRSFNNCAFFSYKGGISIDRIAVFLDGNDNISSFFESDYIKIFQREDSGWNIVSSITIDKSKFANMSLTRQYFNYIVKNKIKCEIVVTNKAIGVPYNVFESLGYSVWELEGSAEAHLDNIIAKEIKVQNDFDNKKNEMNYIKMDDGVYKVDLIKLQGENPNISSKMVIRPILEMADLKELYIRCCHLPPWLEKEKINEMKVEENNKNSFNVKITIVGGQVV